MITTPKINRRSFIVGSAAVGGGLALGLKIPFGASRRARRRTARPRSTPGSSSARTTRSSSASRARRWGRARITGLAQMVAEELECDWSKVTTEYPTPGQSVARKRVWGDFSTGGSRGIRTSQEYVRQGGAVARADADPGRGQRLERAGLRVQRGQQRHHAQALGPHDHLRQGRGGRGQADAAGQERARSRIRRTGRSSASRSSASTRWTRSPARRSTAPT